jgi:L-rhamnose mutarotase
MSEASTETVAFRMRLHEGQAAEYRRRHDEIWPDMVEALKAAGVIDYRIYLDEPTHHLFAVLTRRTDHSMDALPDLPVMRRWWAMMADIMDTGPDLAPETVDLTEVFRLSGDAGAPNV